MNGWIIINKTPGLSSTQVSSAVRRLCKASSAGHAGTLDPLASGILPVALGEATKLIPYLIKGQKRYTFRVVWGESRTTDDGEGDVVERSSHRPNVSDIEEAMKPFYGTITQRPPMYSAIKIQGKRACDRARAGESLVMPERQVRIDELLLLEHTPDTATFSVACGEGTYVRSLARDLALSLGTVGYVDFLQRTQVGPFSLSDASCGVISLEKLRTLCYDSIKDQILLPMRKGLDDILAFSVSATDIQKLNYGQAIKAPLFEAPEETIDTVALMGETDIIALARYENGTLYPKRVFNIS